MFRSIFSRLDCWLRNKPHPEPDHCCVTHDIDELFEDNDPWQTKIYWSTRRFSRRIWDFPGDSCRRVKWAYQRIARGWDDRVVWSVDRWLDDMMPAVLRQLKKDKHGIPTGMFEGLPMGEDGNPAEGSEQIAQARWGAIIDKMIAAFEASRRICSHVYEDELGPYPLRRPKEMTKEEWKKIQQERFHKSLELAMRDESIFKEGMALFVQHYWSLWD